jgi:hypothetical protein
MLYEEAGSVTALFLDTSKLDRDSRKKILTETGGLSAIVFGKASKVIMGQKGMVVTKIEY